MKCYLVKVDNREEINLNANELYNQFDFERKALRKGDTVIFEIKRCG